MDFAKQRYVTCIYFCKIHLMLIMGAFFVTYHSTKLASVFGNVPQSHLYAYTCKIKWDCGTVVCYKSYEISQSTTVPLEFTCISIQVGLWYVSAFFVTYQRTTVPLVKFARELNSRAFQMVHWKHQYK